MEQFLAANVNLQTPITFENDISMEDLTHSGVNDVEISFENDIEMEDVSLHYVLVETEYEHGLDDTNDQIKYILGLDDAICMNCIISVPEMQVSSYIPASMMHALVHVASICV